MANLTGQSSVQALGIAGLRQTSPPAGTGAAATVIIRNDGIAQGGVTAYTSMAAAIAAGAIKTGVAQIVEWQAPSPGGSDTFSGTSSVFPLDNLNYSYTSNLILRGRAGDSFRFTCSGYTISGNNCSFITLDFSNCPSTKFGDSDLNWFWFASSSSTPGSFSCLPSSSQSMGFNFWGGSHDIRILGAGWDPTQPVGTGKTIFYGGRNYTANLVDGSCSWFDIENCEFYLHGNNHFWNTSPATPAYYNSGNLFEMDAVGGLLKTVRVGVSGHDAYVYSGAGVIHDNVSVSNNWLPPFQIVQAYSGTGYPGCRAASLVPNVRSGYGAPNGSAGGNTNTTWGPPYGPHLFINCIFQDANYAGGASVDITLTKMQGEDMVFVGNYMLDNPVGWAFYIQYFAASSASQQCTSYVRFAHNTIVKTGGFFRTNTLLLNSSDLIAPTDEEFHRFQNNIVYDITQNPTSTIAYLVSWENNLSTLLSSLFAGATARNLFKVGSIAHNLIYMDPAALTGADNIKLWNGTSAGQAPFDNPLAAWSSNDLSGLPNVPATGAATQNVRCTTGGSGGSNVNFTSLGSAPNRQVTGLTLAGTSGVGVGTAQPLTTVTTGSAGTTVAVADPKWFPADLIPTDVPTQTFIPNILNYYPYVGIGANVGAAAGNIRRVTAIDRVNKTITLASSATANLNDGVWLAGFFAAGNAGHLWQNDGAAQ
jgi:hypothetical protein